ncbi:hypothetical protein [Micromonospora sp. NPDC023737]|uniref:hypothetical protein n=1 Tax=unclassified Micromonospora TaxID=2617518 RepID=UPI0033C7EDEA
MDPQLLIAAIGVWIAGRAAVTTSAAGRAIAVDGKTPRRRSTTGFWTGSAGLSTVVVTARPNLGEGVAGQAQGRLSLAGHVTCG